MTKANTAELKQLRARELKLSKEVTRVELSARRRIAAIEREISRNHAHLLKELGTKQKAYCKPLHAEARVLRTLTHRIVANTDPAQKERVAIAKRIAVLEGRLAS